MTSMVTNRNGLSELVKRLHQVADETRNIGDELFGSDPKVNQKDPGPPVGRVGVVNETETLIAECHRIISQIDENVSRIYSATLEPESDGPPPNLDHHRPFTPAEKVWAEKAAAESRAACFGDNEAKAEKDWADKVAAGHVAVLGMDGLWHRAKAMQVPPQIFGETIDGESVVTPDSFMARRIP